MHIQKTKPHALLDHVRDTLGLTTDAALADELDMGRPAISRIRHGTYSVTPALILAAHEQTGTPVAQLRMLLEGKA